MTLEEIKADIVKALDEAWSAVADTVDVDKARAVVAMVTSTLTAHAQTAAQHLFDHVLGNAAAAEAAPVTTEASAAVSLDPTSPAPTTPTSSSVSPSSEVPSTTPVSEPSPEVSSPSPTSGAEPIAAEAPVEPTAGA